MLSRQSRLGSGLGAGGLPLLFRHSPTSFIAALIWFGAVFSGWRRSTIDLNVITAVIPSVRLQGSGQSRAGFMETQYSKMQNISRSDVNQSDGAEDRYLSGYYFSNQAIKRKFGEGTRRDCLVHLLSRLRYHIWSFTVRLLRDRIYSFPPLRTRSRFTEVVFSNSIQMAYFGKLVAPNQEKKRLDPIKLPAFDNSEILKQFDRTLVGLVLNMEVQANRAKALMGFLLTVWKCEDRVQGLEMGKGKFHFRFREESDLQAVLDNRPYHFDGWMNVIECWVPTILPS